MVVLNDSVKAETIRTLFSKKSYRTIVAPGFSDAGRFLSAGKIDLIVTDLSLLKAEKENLLRSLRANSNYTATPILVLGAAESGEGVIEALEAGADDYVEARAGDLELLACAARLIERKQAGDLLKEDENYFRSLMDHVGDIISVLSFDGTILYESPSVEQILGIRPVRIVGKNAFDFVHPDDRGRIVETFYKYANRIGERTEAIEYRFRDSDDKWRSLESVGRIIEHPTKGLVAVINSRDVTERRKSERALRDSEEKFRLVLDNSLDIIYQINLKTKKFDYVSSAAKAVTGCEPEDFTQGGFEFTHSLVHPDDLAAVKGSLKKAFNEASEARREHSIEYRLNTRHRGWRWIRENRAVLTDAENKPTAIIATARDVTDQKKFEASLHLQKTLLESQTEASMDGILAVNNEGKIISHNQRFLEMWGIPQELMSSTSDDEAVNSIIKSLVNPQEFLDIIKYLYENSRETNQTEIELKDGRTFERYSSPIKDAGNNYFGRVWFFRDITERKKIETALRESEDNYRDIVENSVEVICTHDLKGNIHSVNKTVEKVLGRSRSEITKLNLRDILTPQSLAGFSEYLEEISSKGFAKGRMAVIDRRGETRILEYNNTLRTEGVAEPIVRGMAIDVTERKRVEDNLRESEARFRSVADTAPVWIWIAGPDKYLTYANKTFLDFSGHTLEEEVAGGWRKIHPDDFKHVREIYHNAFAKREEYRVEYRHLRYDGEYRWILLIGVPRWTPSGNFLGFIGSAMDIHERKQAEEALRATEEKLRQSQKLESVGRLAGGIAHDFNNMLTAIIGYSDISLLKLRRDDPLRRNLEEIRRAAERSASLTSQLLAFSRQQVLQPKIVPFNDLVTDTFKMLQRLISENIHLNIELDPKVKTIEVDPGQLTQVIVNLAVNARDAMPNGGSLTISTKKVLYDERIPINPESVRNGKCVLLTVEDTGVGIQREHLSHVFEPFFTTKEIGKGTGLGLATVYGIVKQSSGEIVVESEVGHGTTFKVYFPCVDQDEPAEKSTAANAASARGTGTILIAEDEAMVRELAQTILENEGYKIITAENGAEAFEICRRLQGRIDLVITDVVMPQMSGMDFAKKIKEITPNLPILFTSGYTESNALLSDLKASNIDFLGKPFVLETLVAKVREFLESAGNKPD
ncbi:MAG: PAS domain S-box protein [Acidobacteria bacterium]|nr:PAS domain S-box protein [Acidobacteriota bacterium]